MPFHSEGVLLLLKVPKVLELKVPSLQRAERSGTWSDFPHAIDYINSCSGYSLCLRAGSMETQPLEFSPTIATTLCPRNLELKVKVVVLVCVVVVVVC